MDTEINDLIAESIIGFDGITVAGLSVHPDGEHIVYPLGCKVGIQNWKTKEQNFLTGHTNVISAVAISGDGKYVASAQINHMGFKAMVILWEFHSKMIVTKHEVHKVRVESVIFSCDSNYLISLGGRDDANIVAWDIKANEALCGSQASSGAAGDAVVLCPTNRRSVSFLSAGETTLRVWRLDPVHRHLVAIDVRLGMIKRFITCIVIDDRDEYAYCGSTSGDIIKVRLNYDYDTDILDPVASPSMVGCYGKIPKKKKPPGVDPTERYCQGVTALALMTTEQAELWIVVAAGDGTVEIVKERSEPLPQKPMPLRQPSEPRLIMLKSTKLDSGATSIDIMGDEIIAGTVACEIYTINIKTFNVLLHITCHTDTIFDLAFPYQLSDVFATCGKDDVRVWNIHTSKELLRITVANFTCASVLFTFDGCCIITGWNDGVIRGFTPQAGKLMFEILNAHNKGVTSIAISKCGTKLISGGGEGLVRVWEMNPCYQKLLVSLREHRGPVSSIAMSNSCTEAVSACTDGTCIIWDIERLHLKQVLSAATQFLCARFVPSDVQVITAGADRKICYWEAFDGSLVRKLEGSTANGMTTLDISPDGNYIVTGSCDMYIKVWKFKEGITTYVGTGHAAVVTAVRFSPDGRYIVSVSADGAIFIWKCPYDCGEVTQGVGDIDLESVSSRSSCSVREFLWERNGQRRVENVKNHSAPSSARSIKSQVSVTKKSAPGSVSKKSPTASVAGGSAKAVKDEGSTHAPSE